MTEPAQYYRLVTKPAHHCKPPGWRQRRKDNVRVGTIWECPECSQHFAWVVVCIYRPYVEWVPKGALAFEAGVAKWPEEER